LTILGNENMQAYLLRFLIICFDAWRWSRWL